MLLTQRDPRTEGHVIDPQSSGIRSTRRRAAVRTVAAAQRVALVFAIALATSGCLTVNLFDGAPKPMIESVVYGKSGPKILMLEINGTITESPGPASVLGSEDESMVSRIQEQLDRARDQGDIQALLLRINSPGGTVTGSDLVYSEIQRYKAETGIPIIAQMMGTAASGGYYVAMASEWVIAHPTTITGSIGVIFVGVSIAGLMEKIGIEDQTLTTGAYKDAGSPLRRMSPEERSQLQSVLDDMQARFETVVERGRPKLGAEKVAAAADGRIYSAEQAKALGLVDEVGDIRHAIEVAQRRISATESRVVSYHRPREWRQNLYQRTTAPNEIHLNLTPGLPRFQAPGFYYLWSPGR
jgi:protease-4